MALVHIDNLAAGMVVKQNVHDRSGRLLLPEGAVLADKHLGILRMWGVLEVEVTDEAEADSPEDRQGSMELDPELLGEAQERVQRLFVHNDLEHPAIKELMRICVNRRACHAPQA